MAEIKPSVALQALFAKRAERPKDSQSTWRREELWRLQPEQAAASYEKNHVFGYDFDSSLSAIKLSEDSSEIGGRVWDGGTLLSKALERRFGPAAPSALWPATTPRRVLELGCGTGLVGMVLARLLANNERNIAVRTASASHASDGVDTGYTASAAHTGAGAGAACTAAVVEQGHATREGESAIQEAGDTVAACTTRIALTDIPAVLRFTQSNLSTNALAGSVGPVTCTTLPLQWGNDSHEAACREWLGGPPDTVIMADPAAPAAVVPELLATIGRLMPPRGADPAPISPPCVLWLCVHTHREFTTPLLQGLRDAGYALQEWPAEHLHPSYTSDKHVVYTVS